MLWETSNRLCTFCNWDNRIKLSQESFAWLWCSCWLFGFTVQLVSEALSQATHYWTKKIYLVIGLTWLHNSQKMQLCGMKQQKPSITNSISFRHTVGLNYGMSSLFLNFSVVWIRQTTIICANLRMLLGVKCVYILTQISPAIFIFPCNLKLSKVSGISMHFCSYFCLCMLIHTWNMHPILVTII